MCFRMVAPSFVTMTSFDLSPFWIILSIPRGPRLVRTTSATALAAMILERRTSAGFDFVTKPADDGGPDWPDGEEAATVADTIDRHEQRSAGGGAEGGAEEQTDNVEFLQALDD